MLGDDDVTIRVHAPAARSVLLVVFDEAGTVERERRALRRDGDVWTGSITSGTVYGLVADAPGGRFDPSKVLLDPSAREVRFPPAFRRAAATQWGVSNSGEGPLAVARPAGPAATAARRSTRAPVVYEAHVRGLTLTEPGAARPGTFGGVADQIDRLAALGVTVIELMPIHQSDPQEGSYWGYMPLTFGAVEQRYATGDAASELADLVAAAHDRDVEVWVDVVYNHTTEVDAAGPTYHLRGLADGDYYALDEHGGYIETTGCGNDVDTSSSAARALILDSLDRLADAGVDGFRFDLAPVVVRHRPFAAELDAWAARRGVRLIAEPWDASGDYLLGRVWPGRGWMQWNDRYRDDVRGFLRAEPGLIEVLQQRLQGSPDLFDAPMESVNFLSCHDGFTLYDVFAYDRKHNEPNGQHNADGAGDNRSWNCGWEGDDGVPAEVAALRQRQLRNAWTLLAMSHGVPMVAMGDEFGRTQGGNNNAYNQDNATSWVDWSRGSRFADLERFVGEVLALRQRHAVLSQDAWWGDAVRWFGIDGAADVGPESRSLAWCVGDLYVIANAWWEPLTFMVQEPGEWRRVVDTSLSTPDDIVAGGVLLTGADYSVGPRSVVVLDRSPIGAATESTDG